MPSKTLQKTKYENLFYYKKDGANHHYLRFTHNGKQYKKKISIGLNHKQANIKAINLKKRLSESTLTKNTLTLEEAFKEMVEHKARRMHKTYKYTAHKQFKRLAPLANKPVSSITAEDINKLTEELLTTYKPAYLYQLHRMLIDTFKHHGLQGIMEDVSLPKFDNTRHLVYHIDDARGLFKAITEFPNPIYRSVFLFGVYGRRKGEIAYLKWNDIYIKNKIYIIQPETNKTRTLDMYSLPDIHVETLKEIEPVSVYVHTNTLGKPLYYFRKQWLRLLHENNLPPLRFHDLRHLLGGIAVNEGFSLEQIGKALGHKRPETTKRYSKLKQEAGRIVVEAVLERLT